MTLYIEGHRGDIEYVVFLDPQIYMVGTHSTGPGCLQGGPSAHSHKSKHFDEATTNQPRKVASHLAKQSHDNTRLLRYPNEIMNCATGKLQSCAVKFKTVIKMHEQLLCTLQD